MKNAAAATPNSMTCYNLEPNIKEAPAGCATPRSSPGCSSAIQFVDPEGTDQYGFLPVSEYNELVDAVEVLWRIRYAPCIC